MFFRVFFEASIKVFIDVYFCFFKGDFMDFLVKVGDQFRVEERLREIDPSYEVFYNKKEKRFEVFSVRGGVRALCVVSPFAELDARLVSFVRKTRAERAAEIIREIEEHNEKLEKKQNERIDEIKKEKLAEIARRIKSSR